MYSKEFAKWLKTLRLMMDVSQEEAADDLFMAQSTYCRLEQGHISQLEYMLPWFAGLDTLDAAYQMSTIPPQLRMGSNSALYNHASEYFDWKLFFEIVASTQHRQKRKRMNNKLYYLDSNESTPNSLSEEKDSQEKSHSKKQKSSSLRPLTDFDDFGDPGCCCPR